MTSTVYGRRRRLNRLTRWGGLVVCVLVAGVWVASVWILASVPVGRLFVGVVDGFVGFAWIDYDNPPVPGPLPSGSEIWWIRRGYAYHFTKIYRASPHMAIPLFVPLFLAAAPTALAWRAELRRRRRERIGKCSKCGYDLAGLAEGTACPECGRGQAGHAA